MQTPSTLLRALLVVASLAVLLLAAGSVMYLQNAAPAVPAVTFVEAANPTKPYVVKLHAQWCPVCMLTRGVWSEVEAAYSTRANLVVFDFTNQATTDASRAEAGRLGLGKVFDENAGSTGTILVLDGRTKDVTASLHGGRDVAEYRAAIDAALRGAAK
jgi:thiol-disulfide isomerase/thioredoxin